jgi:hypothetical protein
VIFHIVHRLDAHHLPLTKCGRRVSRTSAVEGSEAQLATVIRTMHSAGHSLCLLCARSRKDAGTWVELPKPLAG